MKEMISTLKQAYMENPKDFIYTALIAVIFLGLLFAVLTFGAVLEGKM
jgi:hypothetical protein